MDQPYSVWADLLNKFHTSSDVIQMLWLLVLLLMVLGETWVVMRGLRDIAVAIRRPRPETRSLLVYGVVQDQAGQWHVIRHGHKHEPFNWRHPPPELAGQGDELD
jgi:hypothetical protein